AAKTPSASAAAETALSSAVAPAPKSAAVSASETALSSAVSETPAGLAVFHGPGLVHDDLPRAHQAVVHFLDGRLGLKVGRHFNETESFGPSRFPVRDDFRGFDPSARSKKLLELRFRRLEGEPPDV